MELPTAVEASVRRTTLHLTILWIFLIAKVSCQSSENTPPVMLLDRNWRIPSTEAVGAVVTRVRAEDMETDPLTFGLEPLHHGPTPAGQLPLPFTIDNATGVVYLNESLKDRAGQNIFLYVTVTDGKLTAKNEVWVNVVNATGRDGSQITYYPGGGVVNGPPRVRPPFLSLPGFNTRPQLPPLPPNLNLYNQPTASNYRPEEQTSQSINKNRRVQTKTYIEDDLDLSNETNTKTATKTTQLQPTNPLIPKFDYPPGTRPDMKNSIVEKDVHLLKNEIDVENSIVNATEGAVKSVPDLTATIVPVASVCAIFLIVGVVALLFRKKICPSRSKAKKAKMSKDPTGGIVLQDAPRLAIQGWRVPRAFSNRYETQGRTTASTQITSGVTDTKPPPDRWEFPRHHLKVFDILGEGAFGQVWRCEATDIDGKTGPTIVAVKTLKENANEKERSDLLSELQVMKMLEPHPNVVRLMACCTEKDPIFVVMEYISLGKLQAFLRASRAERHYGNVHAGSETLTSRDLTAFVYQVARGMEFLSSKGIIHRDLAARNILITEDHVCKVADFGFARDVITSHVYERKSEGRLPIRWMAPESLYDDIFSVKSDVWSFGVLIWEVVTLGSTPYPGLSAGDVMRKVRDGHRLEKPEHCRRELYNIMYYCWDKDPAQRPTFSECVSLLERLLMTETDYIELERFPDHSYYNVASLSGEKL